MKGYFLISYKDFSFSCRWVVKMGEVVILVDGVHIHDDNNYVVNGLKPWAMDKSKKNNTKFGKWIIKIHGNNEIHGNNLLFSLVLES